MLFAFILFLQALESLDVSKLLDIELNSEPKILLIFNELND